MGCLGGLGEGAPRPAGVWLLGVVAEAEARVGVGECAVRAARMGGWLYGRVSALGPGGEGSVGAGRGASGRCGHGLAVEASGEGCGVACIERNELG